MNMQAESLVKESRKINTIALHMLVNKYNYLKEDYVPQDLKDVSIWYSYEGRKLSNTAYEPFINLFNACKDEGLNIVLYVYIAIFLQI